MTYTEHFSYLFSDLKKSMDADKKLNYYKNELIKILDAKEKKENQLSKAIDAYFISINKSLYDEFGIEKGKIGTVGEIRTWKDGNKYKKMPNGKWVRVYQQQNRSAEISISRLKGKIKNAQSVDELFNIVMANVHRFEDENGQILPIIEELKKEVETSKGRINAGKSSTKEQIETYNKNAENGIYPRAEVGRICTKVKVTEIKVGDELPYPDGNNFKLVKITSVENDNGDIIIKTEQNPLGHQYTKNYKLLVKQNEHNEKEQLKDDEVNEKDKAIIETIQNSFEYIVSQLSYTWELEKAIDLFLRADPDNQGINVAKHKWLKAKGFKDPDDVQKYGRQLLNEKLEKERKEKERKKKAAHEKKLKKTRDAAGEYKEPELSKEYEKLSIENIPESFTKKESDRKQIETIISFMNENKADNNDINYLFSKGFAMDDAARKRWILRKNVTVSFEPNGGVFNFTTRTISTETIKDKENIEVYIHEFAHYIDSCLANNSSTYKHQAPHATQDNDLINSVKKMLVKSWDDIPAECREFIDKYEKGRKEYNDFKVTANAEIKSMKCETKDDYAVRAKRIAQLNKEGQKLWDKHIETTKEIGALEDMLCALSGGKLDNLTYGHKYFNSVGHRTSELLANYVSLAYTKKDQLKIFQKAFPSVAMALDQTIAKMVKTFDERMSIQKSFSEMLDILLRG